MKETSKKRLLELHNTKITAEEKMRLSKHNSFMLFKKLDFNLNDSNREVLYLAND